MTTGLSIRMMPMSNHGPMDTADLRRRLIRAVNRICPASLAPLRDDIVQGAMLRLLEMRNREREDRRFTDAYLRKVAYSVMVDEIRRQKRRAEQSLSASSPSNDAGDRDPASQRPNPEQAMQSHELGAAIADCLTSLKTERSQALLLYLGGYTLAEAARTLGWSKKRTENLVYRGMADLRRCLERKGFTP